MRALADLAPVDLELFVDWIGRAASEGVDLADKVGVWFSRLTSAYPGDPFVRLYWGEALRIVTIVEHGAIMANPDARLWDPVVDKFKRAYALDPMLAVAAVRAAGVLLPTAYPVRDTPEGERRLAEAFDLMVEKGKPFYERFAPWALEGGRGTEDDVADWVGQREPVPGEGDRGVGEKHRARLPAPEPAPLDATNPTLGLAPSHRAWFPLPHELQIPVSSRSRPLRHTAHLLSGSVGTVYISGGGRGNPEARGPGGRGAGPRGSHSGRSTSKTSRVSVANGIACYRRAWLSPSTDNLSTYTSSKICRQLRRR